MTHHRRTGFTLIEMLIAMSLGMAVVYTALAGFRVLTQAITTSRQMSLENGLLRAGMQLAMNEVDFWTTSDDPGKPGDTVIDPKRPMRMGGGVTPGMPFTPFPNVKDVVTGGPFVDDRPRFDEPVALPRGGWNPNPLAWAAWDQRTWTRSNLAEATSVNHAGVYQYWGTFGIYENLDATKSWHHWYGGQVGGLINALGFFGLYDYLPSNSFVTYHGPPPLSAPGSISWAGVPTALTQNVSWLCTNDGADNIMHARIRNTNGTRYFLPGPEKATASLSRSLAKIGYNGRDRGYAQAVVDEFVRDAGVAQQAIVWRPDAWPDISCDVRRLIEHGHQMTTCTITSMHPLTGVKIVIPFAVVGTSLRGARQQRLPTTGWADPFSGPTLDYNTSPYASP